MSEKTSASSIESRMREVLKKLSPGTMDVGGIEASADLFELGVLDSIAVISLVAEIEKIFAFRVDEADFEPSNFKSLDALSKFVVRRIDGGKS